MGKRDDLTGGGLRRSAGGWKGVQELRKAKEYWRSDERVLGNGEFVESMLKISDEALLHKEKLKQKGWDIEKIVQRACGLMGVKKEEILKRGKQNKISQARSLIIYWGKKELGLPGSELVKYFGISKQSISEAAERGERLAREKGHYLTT